MTAIFSNKISSDNSNTWIIARLDCRSFVLSGHFSFLPRMIIKYKIHCVTIFILYKFYTNRKILELKFCVFNTTLNNTENAWLIDWLLFNIKWAITLQGRSHKKENSCRNIGVWSHFSGVRLVVKMSTTLTTLASRPSKKLDSTHLPKPNPE